MNFFQNMISSIMKRTLKIDRLGLKDFGVLHKDSKRAVESVMSTTGEVSSVVYSEHLLDLIENQTDDDLLKSLDDLIENYGIDIDDLSRDIKSYSLDKNKENYKKITQSSEPKWIELFKRLNATSNGTSRPVSYTHLTLPTTPYV